MSLRKPAHCDRPWRGSLFPAFFFQISLTGPSCSELTSSLCYTVREESTELGQDHLADTITLRQTSGKVIHRRHRTWPTKPERSSKYWHSAPALYRPCLWKPSRVGEFEGFSACCRLPFESFFIYLCRKFLAQNGAWSSWVANSQCCS